MKKQPFKKHFQAPDQEVYLQRQDFPAPSLNKQSQNEKNFMLKSSMNTALKKIFSV